MARKGVAILREIAMVKAAEVDRGVKARMLAELNDELAELYKPVTGAQGELPLAEGPGPDAVRVPAADAQSVAKKK